MVETGWPARASCICLPSGNLHHWNGNRCEEGEPRILDKVSSLAASLSTGPYLDMSVIIMPIGRFITILPLSAHPEIRWI